MTKTPYGWPLMADAFKGCVSFALNQPEIVQRFIDETGFKPARTPLEKMIDEAAGRPAAVFAQFCDWVAVNIWGEEEAK